MPRRKNRYSRILEAIFTGHYRPGLTEIPFERSEIIDVAAQLDVPLPKNLGDLLYSFRYRTALPESISQTAPEGQQWLIRSVGRGQYKLVLVSQVLIAPSSILAETKIPDATPGIISKYRLNDEQALLAKLRYNRLLDIFTGLACYSLQSHLRTTAPGIGQVETDEIYVGIDKRGVHYVLPVQAKGASDRIGVVQIEQDLAVCAVKFPALICRPIAAQFMADDLIALFELEQTNQGIRVCSERHYRLVSPEALSPEELASYQRRSP
ncbi:MAG: endonuclease [Anaerolineae bacterium]|nr:endonuclease [Anaerolineae bacterium]